MRAPFAPPLLSEPRKVEADALLLCKGNCFSAFMEAALNIHWKEGHMSLRSAVRRRAAELA